MAAPEALVQWLSSYKFVDRNGKLPAGLVIQYHSRSDEHSKYLGRLIVEDLLDACGALRDHAASGSVGFGINYRFAWRNGKAKTLDLAIGLLGERSQPPSSQRIVEVSPRSKPISRLFIACEEKSAMTEHGKSQPRIYSELNDSHTIVHQGARDTIAAGITMLNIAKSFISPLRQSPTKPVEFSIHDQPRVAASMIEHLRKLPLRDRIEEVGLDAYCTFVVDLDNQGHTSLWTSDPAPQSGDIDEYGTFISRIARLYEERYHDLSALPPPAGLTLEDMLSQVAQENPGLLGNTATLAVNAKLPGAEELAAILQAVENRTNPLPEPE